MAKILYGVSGQGAGHSYRSKEIITHLLERGHQVKVVSYKTGYKNLKPLFDVTEITGPELVYKNNRLQYTKTVLKNILRFPFAHISIRTVLRIVKEFIPDIIFTDFEITTAVVGKLKRIPVISIDNQHQLTTTKYTYPIWYQRDAAAAKLITRLMTPAANAYLITSFYNTEIKAERTFMFPPVLGREVRVLEPRDDGYIFVYLTSEFDRLIPVLRSLHKRVIVYGFNADKTDGMIEFKSPSRKGLLTDLAHCSYVISNAGMTLLSEAVYLHKPVLALPIQSQFEQIVNGEYLEKLGYGRSIKKISADEVNEFESHLSKYIHALNSYIRTDNGKIFDTIDSLVTQYTKDK